VKKLLSFTTILLISGSCAHQTTPSGGPKDKFPPILIKSVPENNQKNFKGRLVELTFDEFVKLSNPNEEIVISPSPGKNVQFAARGNKVTVEPKQDWKDSTTYSISFRNSIQDVNESNPAIDLRLAFSTGPTIDSLMLTGRVTQALTEVIPDKLTIALYNSDTFDITRHTPDYFTQSKKEGTFNITNLKAAKYYVYAFDDKNKNLKVDTQTERFAFSTDLIDLQKSMDSLSTISLPVYLIDSRILKINSIRNSGKTTLIKFNKSITTYSIHHSASSPLLHTFGENQSEIILYNPPVESDSIKLDLIASDSLQLKVDSSFYVKGLKTRVPDEPFKVNFGDAQIDDQTYELSMQVTFNKPIQHFNLDSSFIKYDSLHFTPFEKSDFKIDSIFKKLTITKKIDKTYLKAGKNPMPSILFGNGFLISIQNDSSRKATRTPAILREEDTGTLLVAIQTEHKNYIIELLSPNNRIIASFKNQKDFSFKKLPAQDYKMRAIIDSNGNGVWDPQDIHKKTISEKVIYYKAPDRKFTFPIRAGWELGPYTFQF